MTIKYCHCGEELKYSDLYEASYCAKCNTWAEKKCYKASCNLCRNRPDKPATGNRYTKSTSTSPDGR